MIKLYYSTFETKFFENIFIVSTNNEIVFLHTDKKSVINFANSVNAELTECSDKNIEVVKQLKEYFTGERKLFSLNINFLSGTDFQKKVWNELSKVSYGETISYKDIALKIGHEKAIRATGTAIGKNPLPIIIPCHRIINSNGRLGGFSLGLDKKEYLLKREGSL